MMSSENINGNMQGDTLPEGLHSAILKKVLSSQVRIPAWMFFLFLVNIFISGWHLFERAIEKETHIFLITLIQDFDFSYDFFHDAALASLAYIPIKPAAIFFINIILLVALLRTSERIKSTLTVK